jgi:hypothetical protein
MALNLSTLTSPATSGDVLAEALTTADFLENVPVLRNLARGSQKGGDAKQDVALNQPKALPLIKNPAGNLGGYLYIPDVLGNYATGPSVTIGANQTWEAEVDMVITQFGNYIAPMGGGLWSSGFGFIIRSDGFYRVFSKGASTPYSNNPIIPFGSPTNIKYGFNGTLLYVDINGQRAVDSGGGQLGSITHPLQLNQQTSLTHQGNYAIQKAKLTVNNAVVFDCDFNGSTSIRHGDQKWKAAVGGVVSIAKPELITNGNFDTDTAWVKTGGWSIADGVATLASVSGSSDLISTVIPVTAGKTYKIAVNVIATSGSFRLYDTGGVVAYSLNVGENVYSRVATGSNYQVTPLSLGSGTATIDSISVTEVLPDSGRDPITVVKKSVLRFNGANDFMDGLLNQTVTGGYLFAAFSVLGDGGASYGNLFSVRKDFQAAGGIGSFTFFRDSVNNNIRLKYNNAGSVVVHQDIFDDTLGDILLESELQSGSQISKVNNANEDNGTTSVSGALSSVKFEISADTSGSTNVSYDLEYLALFPSLTDAQADSVRNYINNRNNVFSLIDSQGYYFYDAQKANEGKVAFWNGRIVGSDFGDSDRYATQATANHQPVSDGFKVTFADNSDHLDIASISQAGWQIVGTSLGTFAYRVNANAQVRLNLLGYRGNATYRKAGDLYGIILLPESATGKDIEDARKLLIDRGAADGTTASSYYTSWHSRVDILEFKHLNTGNLTNFGYAFNGCGNLESFPSLDLSSSDNFVATWENCSSISDFNATQMSNGANFASAWKGTTALTSFPAGAKLGTSAQNVNFESAWQSSGLTSLPALDLSNGSTFFNAFRSTQITTIESGVLLGTASASANVNFQNAFRDTPLTSLPEDFNLSKGKYFTYAWQGCTALTSFPAGAKLGTSAQSVNFTSAWQGSGLTSFPALDLSSGTTFFRAWQSSDLISFPANIDLSGGIDFNDAWRNINTLLSFPAGLNLSSGQTFEAAWRSCTSLTGFPLINISSGKRFTRSWYNCSSMTDWPSGFFDSWSPSDIFSGVFDDTWDGCVALSSTSVENILVSINNSGKYGTATGAAGGGAIDSGIDIHYDGTTLSAATNSAVDSLKAKGWSIFINSVEQ